jgi:hypothetical protein
MMTTINAVSSSSTMSTNRLEARGERLWTVRRGERSLGAALIAKHRRWEVRFSTETHWFASQSAWSRELAILCAGLIQDDLKADGWVESPG